jgi:tRNA G18 (ribose-2'-O)-methylase SpoU
LAKPVPITITDPTDPRVRDFTQLTDVALRRLREPSEGLYLAESSKVIRRALAVGHRPRAYLMAPRWLTDLADLVADAERAQIPVYVGEPAVLTALTGFHLHRGAIAAMQRPVLPALPDLLPGVRRIAVLVDVVDHTNVGAMFRSAAALGVDLVLTSPGCADPLYRRAVRVSMGTVFQVPWTRLSDWPANLAELQQAGFTIAALALTPAAVSLDQLAANPPAKLALVLGPEGYGLDAATLAAADLAVQIPMAGGVDSLNVAASNP